MNIRHRIDHLDAAKGIGMILVVLGHFVCIGSGSIVSVVVYSFHMPLFFFLSGVFADTKRNGIAYFTHKVKTLLLPYMGFVAFGAIVTLIIPVYRKGFSFDGFGNNLLTASFRCFHMGPIWFVLSLFWISLLFFAAYHLIFKRAPMWISVLFLALVAVGATKVVDYSVFSYFQFKTALMGFVFYSVGYFLQDIVKDGHLSIAEKILFLPLTGITVLLSRHNGLVAFVNCVYGDLFYMFLTASCGIAAVLIAGKIFAKWDALVFFGQNTLLALGWHQILLIDPYGYLLSFIEGHKEIPQQTMDAKESFIGTVVVVPVLFLLIYAYRRMQDLIRRKVRHTPS